MSTSKVSPLTIAACVIIGVALAAAGSAGGERIGSVPVFAAGVALAFALNWIAFVPAYLRRTERFYDLMGSVSFLSVLVLALVFGNRSPLSCVLAVMVGLWTIRLGSFLVRRIAADGSDGRFDSIKVDPGRFLMTWTLQGLWVSVTVGAALAAMTASTASALTLLSGAGVLVWAVGFAIEFEADREKRVFRADPARDGRFIATGLWAWSRHPNYLGEIMLWTGVALAAAPVLHSWQLTTLVSPLFVTVLLTRISGIPMLEARGRRRWGDDPDYLDYLRRTPVLLPRPPRSVDPAARPHS